MAPPTDVWKPPPEISYSKEAVNRAGALLQDFFNRRLKDGQDVWDVWKSAEITDAFYAVTWWKQQHALPLSRVAAGLRYHVSKENGELNGRIDVAQRLKKRDTIIDKLDRYPKMKLTRMHDIGGVRATLPTLSCLKSVSRRLQKTWTISNTRDYIVEPKASGYRAIHHEVKRGAVTIEVQLRTERQHAWANQVEDDGRALGTGYKFGFGAETIHQYYETMGRAFAVLDRDENLSAELQAELRSRYATIRDLLPGRQK